MNKNHEHKRVLPDSRARAYHHPPKNGPKPHGTYTLSQAAKMLNIEEDDVMDHVRDGGIQMCNGGRKYEDYFLGGQIEHLKCSLRVSPMEYIPPGPSKSKVKVDRVVSFPEKLPKKKKSSKKKTVGFAEDYVI